MLQTAGGGQTKLIRLKGAAITSTIIVIYGSPIQGTSSPVCELTNYLH